MLLDSATYRQLGYKKSSHRVIIDDKKEQEKLSAFRIKLIANKLWKEYGLIFVDPSDINNDLDRQHVINIANKLYGGRK